MANRDAWVQWYSAHVGGWECGTREVARDTEGMVFKPIIFSGGVGLCVYIRVKG